MRRLRVLAWVVVAAACTTSDPMETSTPIEIAVAVERSSEQNVGVDVSISGGDFRETVHVSGDPVIVEVPGPGTYVFVVGGVLEESTGPTTGCWWYGEPTSVEVTNSKTVSLRADRYAPETNDDFGSGIRFSHPRCSRTNPTCFLKWSEPPPSCSLNS